ncbi:SGNH/GDSL hydrolase family protein [Rhizobium binxianense]
MPGIPVVLSPNGTPVTEAPNGFGTPVEIADNGFGTPVTLVEHGGMPVIITNPVNALSGVKATLDAGVSATVLVLGDSTAYSSFGPFYKFGAALGNEYDATVNIHLWAEWEVSVPTGPKEYLALETIRSGSGPTIDIYLAALPGSVAGQMFDASRRPNAIDGIPTPDLIIWHYGQNMKTFNIPVAGEYASGRGIFLGPIGMASLAWPNIPQLITTQNPDRDDTAFDGVYQSILGVGRALPGLTVIDTCRLFLAAGKAANLYRDGSDGNQHPSDTEANSAGAQLVADALFGAFRSSRSSEGFAMPSWPATVGVNLLDNGDTSNWTGAFPVGMQALAGGVAAKDEVNVYGDATYSMALSPPNMNAGSQNSGVVIPLSNSTYFNRLAGKLLSVAVLVKETPTQPRAYGTFGIQSGGAFRTFVMGDLLNCRDGWMWLCVSGIQADQVLNNANTSIRIFPAFGGAAPTSVDPINVQRVVIVEGALPKGLLAA